MIRRIILQDVTGVHSGLKSAAMWLEGFQTDYLCSGNSCDKCKFRYSCYTLAPLDPIILDWEKTKHRRGQSKLAVVRDLVGGKAFAKGTKKYEVLSKKRTELYFKPLIIDEETKFKILSNLNKKIIR
jgi:hypothetical protein